MYEYGKVCKVMFRQAGSWLHNILRHVWRQTKQNIKSQASFPTKLQPDDTPRQDDHKNV